VLIVDTFTCQPFDRTWAETCIRWEPLYEITQIKGDGEIHPFLSPNDEFADYETWAIGNLDRTPRWTAYEAKRFGIKLKEEIPVVTVERAYTSPIWYTP